MAIILSLESFDKDAKYSAAPEPHKIATYDDGYKDGEAAAMLSFANEQTALRSIVVESLSDSKFGYHEAQDHFLNGMQAYLDAILNAVLPATLCHALHAQLRDTLKKALHDDAAKPILLRLPPDQIAAFTDVIDDLDMTHIDIQSDSDLTDHTAFIVTSTGETSLDLDALLVTIKSHSAAMLHASKEVS